MSAWHFIRQLSFTLGARFPSMSRRLIQSSPSALSRCFSSPFLTSYKAWDQWVPNITVSKICTSSSLENLVAVYAASSYLSVRIRCPKHVADLLAEALLCFGATSTSMDEEDASDGPSEIWIESIFSEREDVGTCISLAADSIGLKEILSYEVKIGEQNDWIKKSQESFHPVEVTKGLWIVPEWITPPDVQATNIILNPGLAFGTGEHPTTKLCLLLLHSCIKGGESFLDYGTGSGILAIAALKFGAALAIGIDLDPVAITAACQNASLNNVGPEKLQLHLISSKPSPSSSMDDRTSGALKEENMYRIRMISETDKYDVVIANILLNPLLDYADHIASYAKPGALIGLSGILSEQVPCMVERYSLLLDGIEVSEIDDWACVTGRKRSSAVLRPNCGRSRNCYIEKLGN
ncbi:Ribosomal protein L11 methyltransferase [Quillaja saponaria]|uniref:ETFB lysine methyltransferase n=1 Tax=Quillaja saponaria TaxID=32244 RepID=A0AAD7QHT2_QUISA|nr:Ribosomal protein L11 methyltransferase [Quillaja saponaria]